MQSLLRSWNDITLNDWYKLQDLTDNKSVICYLYHLTDEDYDNLPLSQYTSYLSSLDFLSTPPEYKISDIEVTTENWLDVSTGSKVEEIFHLYDKSVLEALPILEGFNKSYRDTLLSFPNIFRKGSGKSDGFTSTYGTLHLIMRVVELTLTPFDEVLKWPLIKTLNIISYAIARNAYEQEQYKQH